MSAAGRAAARCRVDRTITPERHVSRIFLLSPASLNGRRAALLFSPTATFDLAVSVRAGTVPLGELFSFISGLYFRGKLTYAKQFAAPGDAVRVITSNRGLLDPDTLVTLDDLRAMADSAIDHTHEPYRTPLARDAAQLAQFIPGAAAVLLGSVATDKYVAVLHDVFAERLLFPPAFAGRGDMSRGGLLLRCAREGLELDYTPVMTAARRGTRPPKLAPIRHAPRRATARRSPPTAAKLPVATNLAAMEAKPVDALPRGPEWQYEPKWDGFRCLAFRNGKDVELMSKSGKPLTRYFPEIVAAIAALPLTRIVFDGELVVAGGGTLDFDLLLQRIHPADSRIRKLSVESPAVYIVFDLLARGNTSLLARPLADRRKALDALAGKFPERGFIALSPVTRDFAAAKHWFDTAGTGIDGVIAKRVDLPYQSGQRTGMQKVKHIRTADCVVGGFRYASSARVVGSLLLGLYNEAGKLDHVGFLSAIKSEDRPALTRKLERLRRPPGFTGNAPGGPSRWSTERSAEWEPVAPKLVVEVSYDHFSGGRFRHGTSFVRWRPDKAPRQCTTAQLPRTTRSAATLLE